MCFKGKGNDGSLLNFCERPGKIPVFHVCSGGPICVPLISGRGISKLFLRRFMLSSVCSVACMCELACVRRCGGQGSTQVSSLSLSSSSSFFFTIILRQNLSLNLGLVVTRVTNQLQPHRPIFILSIIAGNHRPMLAQLAFHMDAEDPNIGPQVSTGSTLPTEPSP